MICGSSTGEFVSISALLKNELLNEADAASGENDWLRCAEAVKRLYSVFDDECDAD